MLVTKRVSADRGVEGRGSSATWVISSSLLFTSSFLTASENSVLPSRALSPRGRGLKKEPTSTNWVRGFLRQNFLRSDPLTHFPLRRNRAALSREGRGHDNDQRRSRPHRHHDGRAPPAAWIACHTR